MTHLNPPLLLFVYLIFATLLSSNEVQRTQVIMGTFITISTDEIEQEFIENGFDIFKKIDSYLSSYNPTSTVYKLNHNKTIVLDIYTKEALLLSKRYYKESDGYFDISANYKRSLKVDFGGMGKGYGVDKVTQYFKSRGLKSAIIAASGDIRCLKKCPIVVNNPFSRKPLASFNTLYPNQGVSTSGNYENYTLTLADNHLINPQTKKPQTTFVSLTLTGLISSSDLDAYATAAAVMPLNVAYEFLDSKELAYIILQSDGELVVSRNIEQYTANLLLEYTHKKKPDDVEKEHFKEHKRE